MRAGCSSATATGLSRWGTPIPSHGPAAPQFRIPTACPGSASRSSCCAARCPPPSSGSGGTPSAALRCRGRPAVCWPRAAAKHGWKSRLAAGWAGRSLPACPPCGSARSATRRSPRSGCSCLRSLPGLNPAPRLLPAAKRAAGLPGSRFWGLRRSAFTRIFCRSCSSARCSRPSTAAGSPIAGARRRCSSARRWRPRRPGAYSAARSARAAGSAAKATANFR